jgi:hypothetical protein
MGAGALKATESLPGINNGVGSSNSNRSRVSLVRDIRSTRVTTNSGAVIAKPAFPAGALIRTDAAIRNTHTRAAAKPAKGSKRSCSRAEFNVFCGERLIELRALISPMARWRSTRR